jgi:hypothetical protein
MNNDGKLATNKNKHLFTEHVNRRSSRDRPIFARIKYLCDYGTDNCNPICPRVSYEVPDVMLSVSLLFQRAQLGPLEKP